MIINYIENNQVVDKELSVEEKETVCNKITQMFNNWTGESFNTFLDNKATVDKEISPKKCKDKKDRKDEDSWKSDLKLNRLSMISEKFYSFLREQFFDQIGGYIKLPEDVNDVIYPKAFTIQNKKELNVCLKDFISYGEIVASAALTFESSIEQVSFGEITETDEIISVHRDFMKVRRQDKESPKIDFIRISPENFCYDRNYIPGTADFESCGKIVKTWKTSAQILRNKAYDITKEQLDELCSNSENINTIETSESEYKLNVIRGNQIEVLNYYGDLWIDGKLYEDYIAVVIGRKHLAYIAPCTLKTPRIYYYPNSLHPDYRRGISPMYNIIDLCGSEEKALNDLNDFVELKKNPPSYVPVNFFEEEVTKLSPGKHITYKVGMQDPNAIIKEQFDAQVVEQYREITDNLIRTTSMFNKESLTTDVNKTATEISRVAVSDDIYCNRIITDILVNIIMPYINDCCRCFNIETGDYVKTSFELSNEMGNMNNIMSLLDKIGGADPTMVNIQKSATNAFKILGIDPAKYLNDGKSAQILATFGSLPDEVLQKLTEFAQQAQVEYNNETKARKMMGQLQDNKYREALRDGANAGIMPESVVLPDGQGAIEMPVLPVTPETQVRNTPGVSA
jgi:hypothetical protein